MLEELGLSPTAELIYQMLLKNAELQEADLVKILSLPKDVISQGVASLANIGLITETGSRLSAASYDSALRSLRNRNKMKVAETERLADLAEDALATFLIEYADKSAEPDKTDERIYGVENIRDRIAQLSKDAESTVDTFVPARTQRKSDVLASRELDRESLSRGVFSRGIFLNDALADPTALSNMKWLNEHGARIRTTTRLPTRMLIADKKIAVLPIKQSNAMYGVLVIKNNGSLAALNALFDAYWENAVPFHSQIEADSHELSSREQQVLNLLALGNPDSAIERELHLSESVIRRTVKSIMTKLGAQTRFECGVLAAKEGWV